MARITEFQILNHGYEHGQYFQGCGMSFTRVSDVVTGCGSNAAEAYADAVEQAWNAGVDCAVLPKRPAGIRARDRAPAECLRDEETEVAWRVSIRFNVAE